MFKGWYESYVSPCLPVKGDCGCVYLSTGDVWRPVALRLWRRSSEEHLMSLISLLHLNLPSFLRMCCQFFFSSFGNDLLVLNRGVKCDQSLAVFFLSFFFFKCQIKHKDGRNQIKRTSCALCRHAAIPRCPASNEATRRVSECVTARLPDHLEGGEACSGSGRRQPDLPRSCQEPRLLAVPLGSARRANTDVAVVF